MLLIKSVEVITYLIQEILCLIAIVLYKAFEYRWLLLTFVFFAICLLGGLMGYISITN
jgi:hypothetical protein